MGGTQIVIRGLAPVIDILADTQAFRFNSPNGFWNLQNTTQVTDKVAANFGLNLFNSSMQGYGFGHFTDSSNAVGSFSLNQLKYTINGTNSGVQASPLLQFSGGNDKFQFFKNVEVPDPNVDKDAVNKKFLDTYNLNLTGSVSGKGPINQPISTSLGNFHTMSGTDLRFMWRGDAVSRSISNAVQEDPSASVFEYSFSSDFSVIIPGLSNIRGWTISKDIGERDKFNPSFRIKSFNKLSNNGSSVVPFEIIGDPNTKTLKTFVRTNLDVAGNKVANVATPTDPTDAATKAYTDTSLTTAKAYADTVSKAVKDYVDGRGLFYAIVGGEVSGGSATYSSDVSVGDHIKFSKALFKRGTSIQICDPSIAYTRNNAVPSVGRFKLAAGKIYKLFGSIANSIVPVASYNCLGWCDATKGELVPAPQSGPEYFYTAVGTPLFTSGNKRLDGGGAFGFIQTTQETFIELRIFYNALSYVSTSADTTGPSYCIIEEI